MAKKKPPANRTEAGRFKPGMSGNPTGRPKGRAELTAKCRDMSPGLIGVLAKIAGTETERSSDRIRAAELLLAYGFGKPTQMVGEDAENRFQSFADLVKAATDD